MIICSSHLVSNVNLKKKNKKKKNNSCEREDRKVQVSLIFSPLLLIQAVDKFIFISPIGGYSTLTGGQPCNSKLKTSNQGKSLIAYIKFQNIQQLENITSAS